MKLNMRRIFLLFYCLTLGFGAISAYAQKDILLYSTEFTDWNAMAAPSSNGVYPIVGGGGDGFEINQKPSIFPTGVFGGNTGYYNNSSSSHTFTIKPLEYLNGAVVEVVYFINQGSQADISLTGATVDAIMFETVDMTAVTGTIDYTKFTVGAVNLAMGTSGALKNQIDPAKLNVWHTGTNAKIQYQNAYVKISYRIPSLSGVQTIGIVNSKQDTYMMSLKVYTTVGSTPYVASTNYAKYPAAGHVLSGSVGGAAFSGTPTNAKVKVKGWNIAGNVNLSFEGGEAAKFSFANTTSTPTFTIPNASVKDPAEYVLDVYFTPSVKAGVSNTKLKIETAGVSTPYYVSLTGVTSNSSTPEIIADTATIPFWTYLIAPVTNTLDISGLNLTGNVTLAVVGPDAAQFALSTTSFSKDDALLGQTVTITYTGDVVASTQSATLQISSPGATTKSIPLKGYTTDLKPKMYDLDFVIVPAGTGYVSTSPHGTRFKDGTNVSVTVTPETGYYVQSWSDLGLSGKTSRTLKVSDTNKGTIIITLSNACLSCECQPGGCPPANLSFILNDISASSITDTQFNNISWSAVAGATGGYIVKVFNMDGSLKTSIPVAAGVTTTSVTGLTKDTSYKISVETVGVTPTEENTGLKGPYRTTGNSFVCGK